MVTLNGRDLSAQPQWVRRGVEILQQRIADLTAGQDTLMGITRGDGEAQPGRAVYVRTFELNQPDRLLLPDSCVTFKDAEGRTTEVRILESGVITVCGQTPGAFEDLCVHPTSGNTLEILYHKPTRET